MTQHLTTLRVGLIGAGKMGLHHVAAIGKAPGAKLVGIVDPQADIDDLRGQIPEDAGLYSDVQTLLKEARPDVVHVVTPPHTHVAIARQLIEAGVHVYVEKPFAMSRADADAVLSYATKHNVKICAGHQNLFEKPAILAREQIDSIGSTVHIESYFSFRQVRRTITPADQAKDILPHAVYPLVDQMRAGTGEQEAPIRVSGFDVRPSGDVYALLRLRDCTGLLIVTLSGRPIEQYQTIVGSNGSMRADYVTGALTKVMGPGTGPGILLTPFRWAWPTLKAAFSNFVHVALGHHGSYPGLTVLVRTFYASINAGGPLPMTPQSILDTVDICEQLGAALDQAALEKESSAVARLGVEASQLPPTTGRPLVLVTGGTGLLGRRTVEELRHAGFPVRTVNRRVPPMSARIAGIDYVAGDLAGGLDPAVLAGVDTIVHCAAETSGGKGEQQRNSIAATRLLIERAASAGIKKFLHISSLAVLKPGNGAEVNERTAVDAGNLERGPYVWGKAESEVIAQQLGAQLGLSLKVLRPGPLVDFDDYGAPGRLGREVGPWYVAIGGRTSPLSVLDVGTGARVIRSYVENFAQAPDLVNMVESPAPSRGDLVARLRTARPDLKVFWFPSWLLRALSGPMKLVQRWGMGIAKPLDLYAAFSSERYQPDIAMAAIGRAGASAVRKPTRTAQ